MEKSYNSLTSELATIRAGRANPHVLDKLTVDYYGSPTPIQQVANVSVPGSAHDPDPAMGKINGKRDREGDPDF